MDFVTNLNDVLVNYLPSFACNLGGWWENKISAVGMNACGKIGSREINGEMELIRFLRAGQIALFYVLRKYENYYPILYYDVITQTDSTMYKARPSVKKPISIKHTVLK